MLALSEERKSYLNEYKKDKLKRVPLDLAKEYYDQVKEYADRHDMKVNQLIKLALAEYIENHQ